MNLLNLSQFWKSWCTKFERSAVQVHSDMAPPFCTCGILWRSCMPSFCTGRNVEPLVMFGNPKLLHSVEERKLISDAAMTLALSGSANRNLCKQLGQNHGAPRIKFELLSEHQLPLPMLALINHDQMVQNAELLDKAFPRNAQMHAQRLIMAFDHTYLLKCMLVVAVV